MYIRVGKERKGNGTEGKGRDRERCIKWRGQKKGKERGVNTYCSSMKNWLCILVHDTCKSRRP